MKPQILTIPQRDGSFHAFLVDAKSAISRNDDGIDRLHYLIALNLRGCHAGQIELSQPDESGKMQILAPSPCVLSIHKNDGLKKAGIEARGIDYRAATVLLRLVASLQNIQTSHDGSDEWSFGAPVERTKNSRVMAGTTIEKILAAWNWSRWNRERTKRADRFKAMKAIGYRGTESALRDMLSDLGLVATKPG